ncbi:hypothetical protein D9613_012602 [Agrocybe pediades]|uniref:pyranose dehydrogenase (acceptor) n=1 Tax=Agrocybe pediades TaxID=84607 RepID=A0A8H4R4G5_9AGAR|nr:hypothetical protein D9613_012602 [Agrocybe pediades]
MKSLWLHVPLCLLFAVIVPSFGVILTQPSQLTTNTFDYIIVGGGTAGLVVASRLSENSSFSILVIEAGINDHGEVPLQIPFNAPTLAPKTIYDWNTTTTEQVGLAQRIIPYARGHVLGGSSSINFLFHQYCAADDWNRLGTISGDAQWSWGHIRQYVSKHERMVAPVDGHDTSDQFVPSTHGTSGEVSISLPGSNNSIDSRVFATTQQLAEFPYTPDTSGGDNTLLGLGFLQSSSSGGVRSSSSTTYLAAANSRPNLTVLVNATVIQLIQSGNSSTGAPSFRTVHFVASPAPGNLTVDTPIVVNARKEVILSAGTVGTTQLLQLSGIGNSSDLGHIRINTIINNPDVGNNLIDHPLIPNVFEVTGSTLDGLLRDPTIQNASMTQWLQNKTGPLANSVANNYGFFRLPANSSIFETTPDPASGSKSPHWEIIFSNVWFDPGFAIPATRLFMTVVTAVVSPTSRGTIKLRNNDPFQPPMVDPGFMTTDFDIFAARESIKAALRFVAAPAWTDYVVAPFGSIFAVGVTNDTTIETYVRGQAGSAFHPVGTAAMSAFGASNGVVNPDLTVKGADGLRIVDASVFPFIPSCHTQGPVYLLAERASDIIKAAA